LNTVQLLHIFTTSILLRDAPIIYRLSADYYAGIVRLLFTMYYDGIGY